MPITLRITLLIFSEVTAVVTFGVVFNGKSGFLHGLYYQNISYNGHYRCGSGRGHAQYADFLGTSCAETYIRFLCQRTVRISCNDDKFQFRIQVMRQLCQFDDFPCLPELEMSSSRSFSCRIPRSPCCASLGCRNTEGMPVEQKVVAIFMAICPALPMPEVTSLPFYGVPVLR